MSIVAITREMGSLGSFIGTEVAARLGCPLVRQEITRDAAQEYQVSEARLIQAVEQAPGMLEALTRSRRAYQAFVAAEVLEAALKEPVVIVGRWSTFLLRGIAHAVKVRVCAPLDVRVGRLKARLGIDEAEALRRAQANDDGVSRRVRQVFDAEWGDPLLYDLTLNTAQVTQATGVEQVLGLARAPEFHPTEASRRALHDRALIARVRAALKARPETASVEVEIRVEAGRLAMTGTVASDAELEATLAVTRGVDGVRDLGHRLQVIRMPVR